MKVPGQVPRLKEFMLQRRVIQLYRDFFRVTKSIPNEDMKKEVQNWIRLEFKDKKNEKQDYTIKLLIHQGERSLRELKTHISLSK